MSHLPESVDDVINQLELQSRGIKPFITCALPSVSDKNFLSKIIDSGYVSGLIIPHEIDFSGINLSNLGKFNQQKTMWRLPQNTGKILLFMGSENQFGVKMLSAALLKGISTFIYRDRNGNWKHVNIVLLLFRKLCLSFVVKIARLVARTRVLLKTSNFTIYVMSKVVRSRKHIDILWDTNIKLNYGTDKSVSPEIFLKNYRPINLKRKSSSEKIKVVQYIGGLSPGGAERQLCNLVAGINREVFDMKVFSYSRLISSHAHYEYLLKKVSVDPRWAGSVISTKIKRKILNDTKTLTLLNSLPDLFGTGATELLGAILEDPPHILHAWLDQSNICAAIAGLIADVPVIILSTRNVNPNHFPYLANPLYEPWYRMLYATGRVVFINNSHPGAEDYSRWLDIPLEKIDVVHNGVDFNSIVKSSPEETARFRSSYGISSNDKIIAGIFRFSEEKRPLVFISVCLKLMSIVPGLHVIIAGVGPLEEEVKRLIQESGLGEQFHLLGRYENIPLLLSSSDVLLHASRFEGTPNAVLEAQWLGCPVVATKAGGTADAVKHESTGILVEVADEDALYMALLNLLQNDQLRHQYSQAGPGFISEQFNLDSMINHTVDIYRRELQKKTNCHNFSNHARLLY